MVDAWTLLRRRVTANPGAPFVTHVDAAHGTRTELSGVSVANAAAKIANALRQEFDLEPGDVVTLDLPHHWQRTTWLAGAWTAGCAISRAIDARTRLVVTTSTASDADVAALRASAPAALVVAASLHPFGVPIADPLPDGVDDVTVTVRQQPDAYLFEPPDGALQAVVDNAGGAMTQDEALRSARGLADAWGLGAGGRLLVDDRLDPASAFPAAFAVPLMADAAVVLLTGPADAEPVVVAEGITARAG